MKRSLVLSALVTLLASSASSHAQYYAPALMRPVLQGPDMRGPGIFLVNGYGQVFGPVHYVQPPHGPETGVVMPFTIPAKVRAQYAPPPQAMGHGMGGHGMGGHGTPGAGFGPNANVFPTHPYMRAPRDFFMWRETMEEQGGREIRPFQVP